MKPFIVAIDGPSASGKGTIARKLAEHFGFAYLDTGLLYRAVGLGVLKAGGNPANAGAAEKTALGLNAGNIKAMLSDPELRNHATSDAASKVAAIPQVRTALLKFQQDFCATPPDGKKGAVLDGRDIGTIIAPHADVKIFITASPEARAQRRFKELQSRGENVLEAMVIADMKERDARDAGRAIAPTKPAPDAITLDTTSLTADQALAAAIKIIEKTMR
jgi:CMP/dCMP kinase